MRAWRVHRVQSLMAPWAVDVMALACIYYERSTSVYAWLGPFALNIDLRRSFVTYTILRNCSHNHASEFLEQPTCCRG